MPRMTCLRLPLTEPGTRVMGTTQIGTTKVTKNTRKTFILCVLGVLCGSVLCGSFAVLLARQNAPQTFGMRLIVVPSREEAQVVLQLLAQGREFETVARERSSDPTAADGGYLGRVDPASLRPELRSALQSVAVGNYTGIVAIPSGFAI